MHKLKKEKPGKEIPESEIEDSSLTGEVNENDNNENPQMKKNSSENKPDDKKLKELESQVSALKDQLLRKAAEFENYKRRTENDIANIYKFANEGLIADLLPALDDFSRVKKLWEETKDIESFTKGVELVYEKFRKALEKQGLKEIDSIGKPFDVNLHDAIMQMENSEADADTILDEVEKGYFLKDKVIRHSKVVVSKKPE